MSTNDFVTIAAGNGANTLTVAQYQASGKLALGWQDGIVDGPTFNTMWRQLSTITTMIAQFIADNQGSNVQDNGNIATLEAQFGAAILAYVEKEGIVWCVDTGTADALTANPLPVLTSYAAGQVVAILKNPQVGANATATPSINISSLGAKTITKGSGMQLVAGDLAAGALTLAVYDGSQFRHIGAALSTTDLRVQAGQAVVFQAAGTNAYTGSLIPAPASLTPRMEVLGAFGNANTSSSAPTLQLNSLGNVLPILKQGGSVPQPGDISGFVPLILNSAGTAWLINGLATSDVLALIAANAPVTLRANKTLYVDTGGNDATGTGTQAAPFKTPSAAIAYGAQSFNFAGFSLVIQLVTAGTYAAPGVVSGVPNIQIIGSTSNSTGYVLSGSFANGACLNVSQCSCIVSGLTINNTATNGGWTSVSQGSLSLNNVNFTSNGQTSTYSLMLAGAGGTFSVNAGCSIYGLSCSTAMSVSTGGNFSYNATLSILGNVTVSSAWLVAINCGVWLATISGGSYGTANGATITGTRYIVSSNAVVNTQGGGANYFPGSTAGSTSTGGVYA